MKTLEEIRHALCQHAGSEVVFGMINTRLVLRTGVNLRAIKPEADRDAATVQKVLAALREFGYLS